MVLKYLWRLLLPFWNIHTTVLNILLYGFPCSAEREWGFSIKLFTKMLTWIYFPTLCICCCIYVSRVFFCFHCCYFIFHAVFHLQLKSSKSFIFWYLILTYDEYEYVAIQKKNLFFFVHGFFGVFGLNLKCDYFCNNFWFIVFFFLFSVFVFTEYLWVFRVR